MKRLSLAVHVLIALVVLAPGSALAVGMGGYVQFGGGSIDVELDYGSGVKPDDEADGVHLGGGFVLDTNCAKDELLNYRMNLKVEFTDNNFDLTSDFQMWGAVFDNTLGFGLYRSADTRFWVGPQVRLGYYWGDGSGVMEDASALMIGFGGVMGVNMHFGRLQDLALSIGTRYDTFRGDGDGEAGDFDLTGDSVTVFINLSMMWRGLDDKF